jgi:hypothetical protein
MKRDDVNAATAEDVDRSGHARAADAIFNHAAKAIEIEDVEARVAALEQAAATGAPRR